MEYTLNDEVVGRGNTLGLSGTGITAIPLNDGIVFDISGAGGAGITELTGDVLAGPGSGSVAASITSGTILNVHVGGAAAIAYSKLAALTSGNILVGSAGNVATSVAVTGDIAIDNLGVTSIQSINMAAVAVAGIADTEIVIGTGAGTAGYAALSGDVSMTNAGAVTVNVLDLEAISLTAIADTEILVGDGAGSGSFVSLSGDATMANTGVVTVTGATGAFEAGGAITNAGGTLAVGFIPTAVTQPQSLVAPGAANITTYQTLYTSTGTGDVVTLADATRIGHLKKITYVAEGAGADTAVVTPANLEGFTTVTLNAIGDYVFLMWNGTNWLIIETYGATIA